MSQFDTTVSRRAFAATISLGVANLVPGLRSAVGGEIEQQRTPYSAPNYQHDQDEDIRKMPACRATRYVSGVPATCASKLLVDGRGSIFIYSLQYLDSSGWMNESRRAAQVKMPTLKNGVHSDPDVVPSASSGVLMTMSVGGKPQDILVSNEHALRTARWQLEDKAVYDWHYDLAVIPAEHLLRNADDRVRLSKGTLADAAITNANISSKKVEVVGFGSDLFKFVGSPFKLPFYISEAAPFAEPKQQQHLLFGLRIPDEFIRDMAEIGGMSGSPVVLEGTREVVGIVTRVGSVTREDVSIPYLIFTGPNELRQVVERACKG